MQPLRSSINRVAVDVSPLHLFVGTVRADLRRLLRFNRAMRNVWFGWCLLAGLMSYAPAVSAQPELFGGNPDTSAFLRIPPNTDDWTRHFRIGALVGMNISANFSMNGTFGISGNNPAQGIFDDGYVRTDNTGNAFGQTGYWGYNHASQLNGSALTMHATSAFSASNSAKESGGAFPGFDMAYGDNLWYWKHARVGWELGFGLLPISITDNQSMSASVDQATYTFDTGGIVVPNSPYQGGFNRYGEPTISTNFSSTMTTTNGAIAGKQTLDVMLYTLRLGPTFYWDLTEHVSLSLGAGPAVGLVSGDYKYDEMVTAGSTSVHNSGQIGGTDFVYGGYVNATVLCHVTDNADIYAGAQFMPMSDATISGGGRMGRLNLGGQVYFTVGINWPF
ncbi:MAG TPA: hypothetical protein VG077_02395 [Verrucomicrobiae bacterium]|nr:hypothetical protein [Verrucomicrobiae bacterium]